jgi:hypothetical protein
MADIDRFISRAQGLGAAYILAPKKTTDPLTNLGTVAVPDAELKNGAALNATGLVRGGVSVLLDGTNDFVDAKWATRTNLVTNPNFGGEATTGYAAGSGATISFEKYAGLYPCLKVVTDGKSADQGISLSPDLTVAANGLYTFVPLVIANNAQALAIRLWATNGTTGNTEALLEGKGLAALVAEAVERTMSATTTAADCRISTGTGVSVATTFRVFGFLLVKASKAELEAEYGSDRRNWFFPYPEPLGSLLPDAPGKLATGNCGWTGTANASASDIGPFARGTARTFVTIAERTLSKDAQLISAGDFDPALRLLAGNNNVWFKTVEGGGEVWENAWPGLSKAVTASVGFSDAANKLGLCINGKLISEVEEALTSDPVHGPTMLLGGLGAETSGFKGRLGPVAVFLSMLSERDNELLYLAGQPPVSNKRRKPPLALDLEVETSESSYRLPADAKQAKNKPRSLSFNTQRGDGFGPGGATLSREIFRDYPDINLLDTWRFISRSGEIAYEGKLHSDPRTNDPGEQIDVALVGWMNYLKGRKIAPLVIDSRLSSWGDPSIQRRANLISSKLRADATVNGGWQGTGEAAPGIFMDFNGVSSAGGFSDYGESWFFGGGEDIGAILYHFVRLLGGAGPEWHTQVSALTDDIATARIDGPEHNANTNVSAFEQINVGAGYKYAKIISQRSEGGGGGLTLTDLHDYQYPKVLGTHGLTLTGTWPEVGITITDILRYLFARYYPKVKLAGAVNNFPVQQASWHDSPQFGYEILQILNNLALWETNMWEERTLYHEPADLTKIDWQFKTTDPGVTVLFQGQSIEDFANGCSVSFTDFDGIPRVLWPEDHAELRDENDANPANRHGEALYTDCDVPYPCSEAEALQFGRMYLAEFNRPKRPGTYRIDGGYLRDYAGHWQQGWKVRNGQTCGIMDHPDDEPRLLTATTWDDEGKSLQITVDAPDKMLDAVVARHELARQSRNLG